MSVFDFETGELLLIDKPLGWTSFDVVNHIRVAIKKHLSIPKLKVGHAGTLDPLASGLLIVCTGKMTKQIQQFQDEHKTYTGTIRLGITTPSYDLETEPDNVFPWQHITNEQIEDAARTFTGIQQQYPPRFSAIKIDGKRAFKYARKDQDVEMTAREVNILNFQITAIRLPELDFSVHCSKGTYIRSLAHDFGKVLGSGACLTALRRTASGNFLASNAWKLADLKNHIIQQGSDTVITPEIP
jgi:tRNA pseudouridine55 synthase